MAGRLSFWQRELTPEMVRKAEEELGETEEVRQRALRELKDMIKTVEDFRPRMDDVFLLRFLRVKKFDTGSAFKTLMNYYAFKRRHSGTLVDLTPSQVRKIFDMNVLAPLPTRMTDGSVAGVLRIGYFDPDSATKEELFGMCLLSFDLGMESEATQVCGGSLILDLENFGWRLFKCFASPAFLYNSVTLMQDCLPIRIKGLHLLNTSAFFSVLFNIIKRLLSEKIKSRIFFHGTDLKSLHKFFPPDMLPKELGGTLGPLDSTEVRDRALSLEDYYERAIGQGFRAKK